MGDDTTEPPFNTTSPPSIPSGANVPLPFLIVGGCFSLVAIFSSLFLIYKHLRNYTEPRFQKPIIRILFMVPVRPRANSATHQQIYAINSWLGLLLWKQSIYFDIPRDCYEAYALYQFFTLLVAFLDGERRLIPVLEEKPRLPWPWPLHCFTFKPGLEFYYTARLIILQFVILKPLLSILSLILEVFDLYKDGMWKPSYGFLWITVIDNISITLSLTYLVLFYIATRDELDPYQPIPKFLAVKIVIFFSFWQGVLISILSAAGLIHDVGEFKTVNVSAAMQDFLICIEMAAVAIWHHWAFAFEPYRDPTKQPFFKDIRRNAKPLLRNFGDVLNQGDVLLETQRTFHPKEIKQLIGRSSSSGKSGFDSNQSSGVYQSAPEPIASRDNFADVPLNSPLNPRESVRAPLLFNEAKSGGNNDFALQQDE